jgi:NAD(P)-dependent dehydrogenase (short-subunit alcohol dehydrogenase family)
MKRRGRGSIINLGSLWGLQAIGQAPCAAHSAAKAAVHALTRTLAIEVARHSIRVNAIAPAFVDKIPVDPPELCSFHPLMRRGRPLDVVEAIMFLASETASWITGVVLPVDGGVSAGRHD